MLDQEEHSAETESGEKGEVIKGRTELERWGEYKTGGEGRKGTAGLKKKKRKQGGNEKDPVRGRKPILFVLFFLMTSAVDRQFCHKSHFSAFHPHPYLLCGICAYINLLTSASPSLQPLRAIK